ncbi:MAG: pantoate--beta-alanine ligase [Flavobacteriaceae bacterium]|nr:MAG: pantoate--beta-alanine ligase [Flavobacteriaceae bacterium]
MYICKTKNHLINHLSSVKIQNLSIGFVPTMGVLHLGHLSLIKASKRNNHVTVVSIFINPTQFNNKKDFTDYPLTIDQDIELLKKEQCDVLFLPSVHEMYGNSIVAKCFNFEGLELEMEGKYRAGHFDGVSTIVKLLLEIVQPDVAYFGEKDFQQLQIIKKLVEKQQMSVQIRGCPTHREEDGLAMSSRNLRLSKKQRSEAPFIYATLKKVTHLFKEKPVGEIVLWVENQFQNNSFLKLEYFTIADATTLQEISNKESAKKYRAFIAVFAGEVRLIDNIALEA